MATCNPNRETTYQMHGGRNKSKKFAEEEKKEAETSNTGTGLCKAIPSIIFFFNFVKRRQKGTPGKSYDYASGSKSNFQEEF